jgi:ubiquitin carboxyl-terminal hydrolase 4/11/15
MVDLTNPDAEGRQVLAWLGGKDDGIERISGTTPVAGSQWYLIAMPWLNLWKAYIGVGPVTSSDVSSPPSIDNSSLLLTEEHVVVPSNDGSSVVTRPGLRCDVDYVICPPVCWNFLSAKYQVESGSTIKRSSIQLTEFETIVEVSLKPVKFIVVPVKGTNPLELTKSSVIYVSHKETRRDLTLKLQQHINATFDTKYNELQIRLWKLSISYSLEDFAEFMNKPENGLTTSDFTTIFPGTYLKDDAIEDCEIADEDVVVVELRNRDVAFRFKTLKCSYCLELIAQSLPCACKLYRYCDEKCLTNDKAHHTCNTGASVSSTYKTTTVYASDPYDRYYNRQPENKTYQETDTSRKGLAGLQNLGNTCFMNSGLQCLSNTWPLTEYFLKDHHVNDLNPTNPLGTGGELAKKYANLVKELWLESPSSFSPWEFKRVLGGFASQFSGYSQHDSQELLSFTLDGLHEDLNRVKVKPYGGEITTTEQMTDDEIAEQYWRNFTARNQSVIVDNMYGQYRSEVTCPTCNTVSKTFDPFLMLNVSIPNKQFETVEVTYVAQSLTKILLMLPSKAKSELVKAKVAELMGVDPSELLVGLVNSFALKNFVDDKALIGGLREYESLVVYRRSAGFNLIVEFSKDLSYSSNYSRKVPASLPRIISVDPSISLPALYLELFKYVRVAMGSELLTEEELQRSFDAAFPKLTTGFGSDFFSVNLVNGHSRGSGYSNYYSSSGYSTYSSGYSSNYSGASSNVKACDFCTMRTCDNCRLPYKPTSTLDDFVKAKTFDGEFKLEIVFDSDAREVVEALGSFEDHPSVEAVTLAEQQMRDRPLSINDCLMYSGQPEQLDAENTIYCKVCKEHVQAYKKMEVYKLPKVLIMHLKRFKIQGYYGSKINKTISFPLTDFDLTSYVKAEGQGSQVYDLFAVSNHYGSMSFGHYTAFGKNKHNQQWYSFDDSSCSAVRSDPEGVVVSGAAYVLFYERRD